MRSSEALTSPKYRVLTIGGAGYLQRVKRDQVAHAVKQRTASGRT